MSNYQVPRTSDVLLLAPAKATISALYGVGIAFAVAKEKASANDDPGYDIPRDGYSPDARPNPNGGYDKTEGWDGYMSSSLVGMPVMCYIKFVGGTYTDLQGNEVSVPDIIFETVTVTLNMGKNIEKTIITGRDTGAVKEYIGLGDWNIEIRAIITADAPVNSNVQKRQQTGVYPRANMAEIWKLLRAPIAIPVECWYLNQFDINYIVIDSGVVIQQIEGEYSVQRLIIPACSDNPLIIRTIQ